MSAAYVHGGLPHDEEARLLRDEVDRAVMPADPAGALGPDEPPLQVVDENGYYAPPPQAAAPHPPTPAGRAGRGEVRRSTIAQFQRRLKLIMLLLSTAACVPQIIAVIFACVTQWHWGACDSPLALWMIALGTRQVLHLAMVYFVYFKPSAAIKCRGLDSALNVYQFALIIFGVVWILQSKTCPVNDPVMYRFAYWLFVVVVCIVCIPLLLLLLCVPVACCCTPCLHNIIQAMVGEKRGAAPNVLAELSSEVYAEGRFSKGDAACSICASDYVVGETLRVLPCPSNLHHFHQHCIDKWLKINSSCPICRHHIGPERDDEMHVDNGQA